MAEQWIFQSLFFLATLFVLAVGAVVLWALIVYFIDVNQSHHAVRRNFPVIGRFRYWFEHLGEFFRQYFFAMDREEMPFNRAERSWVYRAAKNVDRMLAFGSTRNLDKTGEIHFLNSAFPTLEEDATEIPALLIGPHCREPFSATSIVNISGMSYGALSAPAVQALSKGAANCGCWMNTGEGGLSEHHLSGGCDIVYQIGTAKYGVRNEAGQLCDGKLREVAAHPQVKMFEIKMSQGAKPGKGGILPAAKVSEEIARIRGIPVNQPSISPNGHPEIRKPSDLLDMIQKVRDVTGKPVGFKAVLGEQGWLAELLDICQKEPERAPDFITIDSADGGSGAAPQPLLDYVGLPLRESLPWLDTQLRLRSLKQRIRIVASGKLINPSKVAWALALGADFTVSARGFMLSLGCIQALQCNKNTCPTGITTHDPHLQRGLDVEDKSQRVANYQRAMTHAVATIAHSCGVAEPRQFERHHVRIVTDTGLSIPLSEYYANQR